MRTLVRRGPVRMNRMDKVIIRLYLGEKMNNLLIEQRKTTS